MNYKGKKVMVTGQSGFLGKALVTRLKELGAVVHDFWGDVREIGEKGSINGSTFRYVDYQTQYLFHLAGPSSQILFNRDPRHCADVTLTSFLNAQNVCRDNGTKLIYASTGLLSQGADNAYARCKRVCEDMAVGTNALGLRIFATYGPGEGHKRDYASVPYLFMRDLMQGKSPVVFGDGTQTRDFIFVDDTINAMLTLAEESNQPIEEIGSSASVSFNEILAMAENAVWHFKPGQDLPDPTFVEAPKEYVHHTRTTTTSDWAKTPLKDGLEAIAKSLL